MNPQQLKDIVEAALFAAAHPLNINQLLKLFEEGDEQPEREELQTALNTLTEEWRERGIELRQVNSGYRFQVKQALAPWISRLSEERPPRYSRALLETLALIVYRQPITRAGIEEIRGVAVSSSIMKTLLEREWIRVVGHRDVPGKPALYGTTRKFLDYFNLKSLSELPPLAEIKPVDHLQKELELSVVGVAAAEAVQQDSDQTEHPSLEEVLALPSTDSAGSEHADGAAEETPDDAAPSPHRKEEDVVAEA
ncbi:MAG: SMC-Scp complex subunit ScpB [Gammaproteobacteria bacterium]